MLDFQLNMKEQWNRSNLETMMGVQAKSSTVQITTLLDRIARMQCAKCARYCVLTRLAFQMHLVLDVSDEDYHKARSPSGRRDECFTELRFLMRFKLFDCWEQFLLFFSNPATG